MPATPTRVYPVPGTFLVGTPMVEQELPTKAEADALVATGAFALSEKDANAASPWGGPLPEPEEGADDTAGEPAETDEEEL